MAAAGKSVGKSLCEHELVDTAKALMAQTNIPLPTDVITATEFSETADAMLKSVEEVAEGDMIFDIGPETAKDLAEILKTAGTIIWNGPVGV